MNRRPPLVSLVAHTVKTGLPGRRWVGVLAPTVLALLIYFLATPDDDLTRWFTVIADAALFPLVLPITCLVVGDGVLGADIRAGTFSFTWMSPVPTWLIALARWIGAMIVGGSAVAGAFLLSCLASGAWDHLGSVVIAAFAGSAAYLAVFLAIGCTARRAATWSLVFVFLVERLLGGVLDGIAQISPGWLAREAFIGLTGQNTDLLRDGLPDGIGALVQLGGLAAVALAFTSWRLRHIRLAGAAD